MVVMKEETNAVLESSKQCDSLWKIVGEDLWKTLEFKAIHADYPFPGLSEGQIAWPYNSICK